MPAITGQILMNMGKQLLKSMTKKAVKATVKKKKVKGKDVAKKMFGGEEKGGALALRPKVDIVPSPAGKLSKTEEGGQIVKSGSKKAAELGLTKFMDSVNSIQTSVESVKLALNDNKESALARIEDQRLINAKIKKDDREAELEAKKPKKKKGPLSGAKDAAEGFLARMARFATMTLLGSLIAALMGGARDVILAFRIGIEAIKKGIPTLLKGVKALKAGIGKAFKLALSPFKALGNLVFKGFQALGNKLIGMVKGALKWVDDAIKGIVRAGAKAFPKAAQAVTKTTKAAGTLINQGKTLVKNTVRRGVVGAKRFIGRGARKFLKGGGSKILKHGLKRGANRLIIKWFGKGAAKTLMSVGKTLVKGAKAIKIPVIGPLLVAVTSMFSGDPIGQTLFKTLGAALGGGIGLALGPIGMIVGEIVGEFIGDVLYEGFRGKGWKAAGAKLKKKFMQIVKGGKVVIEWVAGGFKRFWGSFMDEHSFKFFGKRIPNPKALLNPLVTGPLLVKSFFPPGEKKKKSEDTEAKIGEKELKDDAKDVSESASYEDGAEEDTTVVIDGGGDQASSPTSSGGGTKLIPLSVDKLTLVNSQYELQSTAALYKV